MKKILKATLGLLAAPMLLASCDMGGGTPSGLEIYQETYNNGSYLQTFKESETSSKPVYVAFFNAMNRTSSPITINSSDFKMVADKKEYPAYNFVDSYVTFSDSGAYIKTYAETKSIESSDKDQYTSSMSSLYVAFEFDGTSATSLYFTYKGNELKALGK